MFKRKLFKPPSQLLKPLSQLNRTTLTACARQSSTAPTIEVNPAVYKNLPLRWNNLSKLDQEEIQLHLEEQMEFDWRDLTLDEKRSSWYIAYGHWGPRAESARKSKKLLLIEAILAGSFVGVVLKLTMLINQECDDYLINQS